MKETYIKLKNIELELEELNLKENINLNTAKESIKKYIERIELKDSNLKKLKLKNNNKLNNIFYIITGIICYSCYHFILN
jgi:hypothetical protein